MIAIARGALVFALLAGCNNDAIDAGANPPGSGANARPSPSSPSPQPAPIIQPPICSDDHWCWENPLPQGNRLNAIWGAAADDVWVGGDSGLLLHFDGHTWQRAHDPMWNQRASRTFHFHFNFFTDVRAIWGASKDDVWAATDRALAHWDGKAWTDRTAGLGAIGADERLEDIVGVGARDVWIAVRGGAPLHWDGTAWARVAIDPTLAAGADGYPYAMWATAGDLWLVGGGGVILRRDGATWKPSPSGVAGTLTGIFGSGPGDIWVAGLDGVLLHGDGTSWKVVEEAAYDRAALSGGRALAPDDAWAMRGDQVVHFDGHAWTPVTGAEPGAHALYVASARDVWLVGDRGVARGDGKVWTSAWTEVVHANLSAVAGTDENDVWAVGDDGTIVHRDASGWHAVPSGTKNPHLIAVWALAKDDAWAGGYGGELVHWDGRAWHPVASGTKAYVFSIWGTVRDDVWVAGSEGMLLHWNGSAFTAISTGTKKLFTTVTGTGKNDVWAVGPEVALRWDGRAWARDPAAGRAHLEKLWVGAGEAWGVLLGLRGLQGEVARRGGKGWTHVPLIPELAGTACLDVDTCGFLAEAIWGRADGDVWVAGELGAMHWDGRAWTWSDMASDTVHINALWGAGDHLFAVGDRGLILHRTR